MHFRLTVVQKLSFSLYKHVSAPEEASNGVLESSLSPGLSLISVKKSA